MKKIFNLIILLIFLATISACAGYKPIFGSSDLKFKIEDYSILGDKKIGNKIFSKLNNMSRSNKNDSDSKKLFISINTSQNKNATAKDGAGNILGYRINLSSTFIIKDLTSQIEILNYTFSFSSTYNVQDQFSETKRLKNQTIENLINNIYQDLIIKLSENIL